jgi:hypothetical protein
LLALVTKENSIIQLIKVKQMVKLLFISLLSYVNI